MPKVSILRNSGANTVRIDPVMKDRVLQNRKFWLWQAALLAFLIACGLHSSPPGAYPHAFPGTSPQVSFAEFPPQSNAEYAEDDSSEDDEVAFNNTSPIFDFSPVTHLCARPDAHHPLTKRHHTHHRTTLRTACILTRSDSSPPPVTLGILLTSPQVLHNETTVIHRFGRAPPTLS